IPHLQAAINGMQFFQSVIATPEVFSGTKQDERYIGVQVQVREADGSVVQKVVPVELKSTEDILFGSDAETLAVRGNELDKMIALIALTERSFGFRRYEQISMRVSYPEVERMLLLEPGESAAS